MDIFALLDEIQIIARNGMHFAENPYDRERYERLMSLTTKNYSDLLGVHDDEIRSRLLREVGHITPKVGADAAIFNTLGEILLMDRIDGSGWCLPCGWVEPNERPADTVIREVYEETGLHVTIQRLVGVFTRMPSAQNGLHSMVAVVHLCDVVSGALTLSHEGLALQYWPIEKVEKWHGLHKKYALAAHEMWQAGYYLPAISD